jgi:hypothetical protein
MENKKVLYCNENAFGILRLSNSNLDDSSDVDVEAKIF